MARPKGRSEVAISVREAEVLAALGARLSNAEISARLFISVRTVESHVSALLRKLQVDDRRALAHIAANLDAAPAGGSSTKVVTAALPTPLTPFVGRTVEAGALSAALSEHRLVTAVGPGGVGKTRLAWSVAADLTDRFVDGVWYVDLVPVTDPVMIAPAIADVLGLGERLGSSAADSVLGWLAQRRSLLVLDNCEHLLDGVAVFVERLLESSPRTRILATSRARLLLPFEGVFPVPGLSVETDDGGPGDAVELFLGRAAAGGTPVPSDDAELIARIAAVCRALDGSALAIELAAARYPSTGLSGLEAGLADRLALLTGGRRVDERHRSLRSTLDWSYALLSEADRAVLRRVSVFAGPFTAATASTVAADWPPVAASQTPTILAGLADHSLLIAIAGPGETRYRVLETIRQYGAERLDETSESVEARSRHLDWCLDRSNALDHASRVGGGQWRADFDEVADELRSALAWAATTTGHLAEAYRLAIGVATLCFLRGLPGESQRRYEQAAELAVDDARAADALRCAAGAAAARNLGDDAQRLRLRAVEAAIRSGDRTGAALDIDRSAEAIGRFSGTMATQAAVGEAKDLIARGWALGGADVTVQAQLLVAEAFNSDDIDPAAVDLVERALRLARQAGDRLIESAALDQLTAIRLARGDVRAAAASALRRTEVLAPLPVTAINGLEFFDAFLMAAECETAAGDLRAARRLAEGLGNLPFCREEAHLTSARLLVVAVLAGDWSEAVDLAERLREGWERAGRPQVGNLSRGAYAAAIVHGLRGDEDARVAWSDIAATLATPGRAESRLHFDEFFDAMLLLHRGSPELAMRRMTTAPEDLNDWYSGLWRPWYAALWAEAAVLTRSADATDRLQRARIAAAGNPIAAAIVDRAEALHAPRRDNAALTRAAAALHAAGCRYQWARTLVQLGGADRARGEAELAIMGATPMVWPPS